VIDYKNLPVKQTPLKTRRRPSGPRRRRRQPEKPPSRKGFFIVNSFLCLFLFASFLLYTPEPAQTVPENRDIWGVNSTHIAESISSSLRQNEYPQTIPILTADGVVDARISYNIKPKLEQCIDSLLERYKPDFAGVAAIDPTAGHIIAMSSFIRDGEPFGNLAMHSGFPAASLFKIITAAALIDQEQAKPSTVYEYNGKDTSLYKKNVLRHKKNKWTKQTTLERAFGRSINTVFGRLGIYHVGGDTLAQYANTFGFDKTLPIDFYVDNSKTDFDTTNEWSIAEVASGFTRTTTISPLHAAMVVSAIVNNGVLVTPRLINKAVHPNGPLLYKAETSAVEMIDPETANDMRILMRHTVKNGSARKSFRKFFRGDFADFDAGGKTGSLTGHNPRGRTEWFAGYGDAGDDKIVIATVIVNKDKWRIKPAYLTRKVLEHYFNHPAAKC